LVGLEPFREIDHLHEPRFDYCTHSYGDLLEVEAGIAKEVSGSVSMVELARMLELVHVY
jgi:hypothetical protein